MMKEKVRLDWERCITFHGHICPGLAIGFQATQLGLRLLQERDLVQDSPISGIVSIVQNDACGVDAVQVLTGCTFGKGNLLFIDHGKQVFRFVRRQDGRGIRIALKHGAMENETHHLLRNKVVDKTATPDEAEGFIKFNVDTQARGELQRRNISGVPTFLIGEDVVVGLDKAKILKLVDHRVIQCEKCARKMRVPINKGTIKIKCPQCAHDLTFRHKHKEF